MEFVYDAFETILLRELRNAAQASIVVAYFDPNERVMAALQGVEDLTLIASEEYAVTNPYKLERLERAATVRTVPTDCDRGKLHAKVFFVTRRDKTVWAMVGSANMTIPGLGTNQEGCLVLESRNDGDLPSINQIARWFRDVLVNAREPAIDDAKKIFDARSDYRLEPRSKATSEQTGYWVLKTTSGSTGEDQWKKFLAHKSIAIGWGLPSDPSSMSTSQLERAIATTHADDDPHRAAIKVKKFLGLRDGDLVLISRGYAPTRQDKPVHVYGIGRVLGPFRFKPLKGWDWFARPAVIQEVDANLPRDVLASALRKASLMHAIHEIDERAFHDAVNAIGVPLRV